MMSEDRVSTPLHWTILGFLVVFIASAVLSLSGCAKDSYCELDLPEVAAIVQPIINGEVSVNRRSAVKVHNVGRGTYCTGTIVGPHTVLFAAHCVVGSGKSPGDPASQVNLSINGHPSVFGYEGNYEAHPSYDGRGATGSLKFKGDLAVAWFDDVLPEPYASIAETPNGCYPGLIVQGYGRTENGYSRNLHERVVYETFHNKRTIFVTEGPCFGDSGGGLYVETPEGLTIIGVTSFSRAADCHAWGLRGANGYTNLYTYGAWARDRTF